MNITSLNGTLTIGLRNRTFFNHSGFGEEGFHKPKIKKTRNRHKDVLKKCHVESAQLMQPTDMFLSTLTEQQIIACISYHFRADHWDPGSLIHESLWSGALLKFFEALVS